MNKLRPKIKLDERYLNPPNMIEDVKLNIPKDKKVSKLTDNQANNTENPAIND